MFNTNVSVNVYGAVITTTAIARVHQVHWFIDEYTQRLLATHQLSNQATHPTWAVSPLPSTSTIAIYFCYYSTRQWILIYRPVKGGRLSRPWHCRNHEQPVAKAGCACVRASQSLS